MLGVNMACMYLTLLGDGMEIEVISKRRSAVRERRMETPRFRRTQEYVFEHRSAWRSPMVVPSASEPGGDGKMLSAPLDCR